MQNILKQAYQAEVLIRECLISSVGTKYPFKDQVVITTENTYQVPDMEMFTYTHRIDICVKCENRLEAFKLDKDLKDYFKSDKMLPLHVGVFQKPYTKEGQKSRKHYAFSTISAKDLITALPEFKKDKKYDYAPGQTNVETLTLTNGFDLKYMIVDYTMEHLFLEEINGQKLDNPFYKLKLYTSSIIEDIDDKTQESTTKEELIIFEINGNSKTEILDLAKKLYELKKDKKGVFTCKGNFPKLERDFYTVRLDKNASQLFDLFAKTSKKA